MTNTNATNFRKNIFEYLNQAVEYNDVINITTKNGNAVVLSESDYNSLLETVYLMSHPATRDTILEGMEEELEDCVPLDEVDW
jgi:prevent-host-death family protein